MSSRTDFQDKHQTTRARISDLLRKGEYTVDALAQELGITKNAVRSQLALLQREGIAEVRGEKKGARRPAAVYGVQSGVDVHFSQAYPLVLSELVRVLSGHMPPRQFIGIMRAVGTGLAAVTTPLTGSVRERVAGAADILRSLGSIADVIEEDGNIVIRGHGCPLSKIVKTDIRSCAVIEALLGRLTGLPVAERCDHSERPSCRFEFKLTGRPEK